MEARTLFEREIETAAADRVALPLGEVVMRRSEVLLLAEKVLPTTEMPTGSTRGTNTSDSSWTQDPKGHHLDVHYDTD